MSYSNRGIFAALAGLTLLWGAPLSAQDPSDAGSGQSGTGDGREPSDDSPSIIAAIDRLTNKMTEARIEQADAYGDEREQRERRDVVAQESMAYWAEAMFWAIITQTLLAFGALWALVLDLRQNRESAERQLRAYLIIQSAKLTLQGGEAKCIFTAVNAGQTPASEVVCKFKTYAGNEPRPLPHDFSESQDSRIVRVGSMGQNSPHPHAFTKPCANPEVLKALRDPNNPLSIFLDGIITYTDSFGHHYETEFAFAYRGEFDDVGIGEGNMIVCEGRNSIG